MRTAISLIGFGLLLHELELTLSSANKLTNLFVSLQTIAVSLLIVGILVTILAVWRYNQVFWQLEKGNYKPNRWMIWITGAVVIILGLLSLPFLVWRSPAVPQKSAESHPTRHDRLLTQQVTNKLP